MSKHLFLIKLKDGTSNVIVLNQGDTELYFKTLFNCVTDSKIESYKLFSGSDVTNEDAEHVLKCCKRFLGID
ncbi:hypothetical protein [Flavobacterium sp. WC2429]|uniref:Uncharacterized protein n=1 Tax=Flavobacterium sp. WC2429 TaxID=3234140 RepID=A0AB39WLV9_9FLAO